MRFILLFSLCYLSANQAIPTAEAETSGESKIWAALKDGVVQIFALEPKLTIKQYIELNRQVYDYCTNVQKFSQNSIMNRSTGKSGGAELIGEELYQSLKNFLENYLSDIFKAASNLNDEELLSFYSTKWEEYQLSSRTVNRVFDYINRHWVKRQREEGNKDVYRVYDLTILTWREYLFKEINQRLTSAVLNLIERERNGEIINVNLISKAVASYIELGIDKDTPNARITNLSVYKESFENRFIEETERYYTAERDEFVQQNSFIEYMKRAEQRINEETTRVEAYLHKTTLVTLQKTCDRVLIENFLPTFHTEFQNLLDADEFDDLGRLYSLTARVTNGLASLNDVFEEYVHKQGIESIAQMGDAISDNLKKEPRTYIEAILKIYNKYYEVVTLCLRDDHGFMAALDKACRRFINENAVTKFSKKTNISPELLARYIDSLLRKSSKTENLQDNELEAAIKQAIIVFKFIQDKDVFQEWYKKMLASRMVNRSSTSEDAEKSMLAQLKEICGFEYTSKLQKMFDDMILSNELSEKFRESVRLSDAPNDVDLNAQILSNIAWEFPPYVPVQFPFQLPKELVSSTMTFQKFFSVKHAGRQLIWLYHLCKGEMTTHFLQKKYVFQVSLFQMAVLLQFNDVDSMTVEDLAQATGISEDILIQVLQTLVKATVLKSPDEEMTRDSIIELNQGYKNKKLRVNLNIPLKKEIVKEQENTEDNIIAFRVEAVMAQIVRVLKARQTAVYKDLVIEVSKNLLSIFHPDGSMFKKAIAKLLEKEYVQLVEGTKDTYAYVTEE